MKKLAVLIFVLSMTCAHAEPFQSRKTLICDKLATVLKTLNEEWNEVPQWTGQDLQDGSTYLLTANEKEKTWTLIQLNNEVACVLGVGKGHRPVFGQSL